MINLLSAFKTKHISSFSKGVRNWTQSLSCRSSDFEPTVCPEGVSWGYIILSPEEQQELWKLTGNAPVWTLERPERFRTQPRHRHPRRLRTDPGVPRGWVEKALSRVISDTVRCPCGVRLCLIMRKTVGSAAGAEEHLKEEMWPHSKFNSLSVVCCIVQTQILNKYTVIPPRPEY